MHLLTLRVSAANLGTVIGAVQGAADVVSVEVEAQPSAPEPKKYGYKGGKRDKGISADDLAYQIVSSAGAKGISCEMIAGKFEQNRPNPFAGNSAGPALARLLEAKKITRVRKGVYALPDLVSRANGAG